MKIDPVQVFANSIGSIPFRILFAWLAISLGSILSLVCDYGMEAFENTGFIILAMPIHLIFVACIGDWWVYISVPLLFVVAWKGVRFIVNDNTGSDLVVLILLAYLVTSDFSDLEGIVLRSVFGVILLFITFLAVRRNRDLYPE